MPIARNIPIAILPQGQNSLNILLLHSAICERVEVTFGVATIDSIIIGASVLFYEKNTILYSSFYRRRYCVGVLPIIFLRRVKTR